MIGNYFFSSSGAAAYEIEQSLRFNSADSAYLNRTPSSSGNRRTWTWSGWCKVGKPGESTYRSLMEAFTGSNDVYNTLAYSSGQFWVNQDNGSGGVMTVYTTGVYRDPSAWYHTVFSVDTTQATATNRVKIYINGVQVPVTFSGAPSQNLDTWINGAYAHRIGARWNGPNSTSNFEGYLAEVHFIDGSALDPEDFGEFDNNGVWRPIEVSGLTYGTNGFYLTFDSSATNGIGHDHSGNGNNFTATGFTTSGTGTDVMSDTPTNNFATLNPLIGYQPGGLLAPTFSDGNLTVAPQVNSGNNSRVASATLTRNPANGGVWRWEMVVNNTNNSFYGIMAIDENYGSGNFGPYWGASGLGGNLSTSGGASASLQEQHQTISAGDVIGIKVSFDDNEVSFWINGTRRGFYNGCNFSNYDQLVPFFKESTRTQTPCTFDVNFGQKAFQYTTSGDAWGDLSTLPAPDIADGSDYFKPLIYLPDGSSSFSVTGVGFQPDFAWIKSRNYNEDHQLNDAVRGATKALQSNLTSGETTQSNGLTSFDSDGFTVGNLSDYNYSGDSIISWNWLAGGSGSSNTAGSVPSTVSANPTAGFSIITWNTSSSSAYTVGHGLDDAPKVLIVKKRDGASNWFVRHGAVHTGNGALFLNSTGSGDSGSTVFNGTNPSDTVITLNGASTDLRGSQICYAFAEVEGYSKLGVYSSNNNLDGPVVYTGFTPALVVIKSVDGHGGWMVYDTARMEFNPGGSNSTAYPVSWDRFNAESFFWNAYQFDILSNGFKLRSIQGDVNYSGNYVFMAFAENPFGGSGVSPATAR